MVVRYQLYILEVPSRNLMANDERNFRSSYYEKVGCRSVEEKKSLEILLKDKPWDKLKLKQFCLRFTLPGTYRNLLWKVLLDILPIYTTSHDFVLEQRQTQYKNLTHAVSMMKIVDKSTPKPQLFVALWYLETGRLQYGWNVQVECGLTAIAETLLFMFDDDEAEIYWLARGFYEIVESFERDIPRLIDYVKSLLEKEDDKLFRYLVETKVFESLPLAKWFNCCFAGILGESALAKIWDKLCGGAPKMLVFVAVVLLVTMRRNILKCKDIQSALNCLQDIPRDTQEVIANKAIELWQHYGSMLPVQNDSHHNTNKK